MNHASLNVNESLSPPGNQATMSRVALFEVILARVQTVYHIPPRLVLTLMSQSWGAPLVSSCVAKAIHCESKGQEGESHGRRAGRQPPRASIFFFPPWAFFKSRCCDREKHRIHSKQLRVCLHLNVAEKSQVKNDGVQGTYSSSLTDKDSFARINIVSFNFMAASE